MSKRLQVILDDAAMDEIRRIAQRRRVRTRGSHHQFAHPTKRGIVTVPHTRKDLGKGLVIAILRQAGLK